MATKKMIARAGAPYVLKSGGHEVTIAGLSVFEQLGFSREKTLGLLSPVVDEVLRRRNSIKDELVDHLVSAAEAEHLNITQMAERVAMTRPRISSIMNRDFDKVSIDAVIDVLHRFGKEVRVQVVDARETVTAVAAKPRRAKARSVAAGTRARA